MDLQKEHYTCKLIQYIFIIFIAILLSINTISFAQGDLLIFPKRILFEGRNRVEQITLVNSGKDVATYIISFLEYKMTESGEFVAITEPDSGQHFATPFLRVFPRRVDLGPGESQTVKVQVINADKMEEGEYRSHLYFRAEINDKPLGQDDEVKDPSSISVKLEAVFGISIATIIRKGTSNTIASLSNVEYYSDEESNSFLIFAINRNGNMSTYGDITIIYTTSNNTAYEVGKANGLAVYTPGIVRKVKMQLQKPEGINFSDGKFKVVFTQNESKKVLAEAELKL
jgi:hypothetical protein